MTIQDIKRELDGLGGNNPEFYAAIVPNSAPMRGVRIPALRKLAQRIARDDAEWFLRNNPADDYEMEMLQAFVIGYAKMDISTQLDYFEEFIPKVHDWAVNDCLCQTFKAARKYPKETWDRLTKYFESHDEYEIRVVAVMFCSHFLVDDYIDEVIEILDKLHTDGKYYAQMAVAWALATVMAKYPDKCLAYMNRDNIQMETWTYNKAIQKMRESYRVSAGLKSVVQGMKKY